MKTSLTLRTALLFSLLFFLSFSAFGQNENEPEEDFFFGNISPVILQKDAIEVNFVNSLASLWIVTRDRSTVIDRSRSSRLDTWARISYGFSENRRWDLGAELRYSQVRNDGEARSSPFRVLGDQTSTGRSHRNLSQLGIRLRVMPFESVPELTVQGTASFSVVKDELEARQLGTDRHQTDFIATYFRQMSGRYHLFLQAEWLTQFSNEDNGNTTHFPVLGAFLVADFLDNRLYIFPGLTYAGTYEQLYDGARLRNFGNQLLGSIGLQYQPTRKFGIFVNGSTPFVLDSGRERYDFVNRSYIGWSLGLRGVF